MLREHARQMRDGAERDLAAIEANLKSHLAACDPTELLDLSARLRVFERNRSLLS